MDLGPRRSAIRTTRISLLHASYHRQGGPLDVRDVWLARAVSPEIVEYVLACESDDLPAVAAAAACTHIIMSPEPEWSTAVRNWNAAATIANGDVMVVIADDLYPETGWDVALRDLVRKFDPRRRSLAIKVVDNGDTKDVLLRHPIITRSFYERFGLFDPEYHGVCADNDFTLRAFWNAAILDGRHITFQHDHPTFGGRTSRSHVKQNRDEEYAFGKAVLQRKLSAWRYGTPVVFARTTRARPELILGPSLRAKAICLRVGRALLRRATSLLPR